MVFRTTCVLLLLLEMLVIAGVLLGFALVS
jgi:hypothetical protein